MTKKYSAGDFFGAAWNESFKNWGYLWLLSIILLIPYLILTIFAGMSSADSQPTLLSIIFSLFAVVYLIFVSATSTRMVINLISDNKEKLDDIAKLKDISIVNYVLGSIWYSLIVLAGTVLFIIPGVIWGIKYGFAFLLIIDKKLPIGKAFKVSAKMTSGYKWTIFIFGILTTLVSLAISFTLGLALIPLLPFFILVDVIAYVKIRDERYDEIVNELDK